MLRISLRETLCLHELRIALLSYVFAKQTNHALIVRLESSDEGVLETLLHFGLSYQHLYYQKDNVKYHLQFASTLLDRKKAFICFCPEDKASPYDGTCEHLSSEEILNNPNPFVIRMKRQNESSDSFIIMDRRKYPTAIFATACDDMLQGVTHILQEAHHKDNASDEAWVRQALGYEQDIHYTYLAPLSHAHSDVKALLDEGFLPEAITNYLLALGNTTRKEIFTLEEAISWLDINALSTVSTEFDKNALCDINREHIQQLDNMELSKRIGYACENVGKLAKLYTQECSTTHEIKQKIDAIFAKKEPLAKNKEESLRVQTLILEAPYFEHFDDFKAYLLKVSGLDNASLLPLLRFWLTGASNAPTLDALYPFIKTYLKEIAR